VVIRIAGAHPRPATFADSWHVELGDIVLALGNPLGLRSSVTERIVSAMRRSVPGATASPSRRPSRPERRSTPATRGGALADLSGRVIGSPTLAALDPEWAPEARTLWRMQHVGARHALEPIHHRRARLLQAGERQLHLGLDSDGPHDSGRRCRVDGVLQQGPLTDARLPSHHQGPALTPRTASRTRSSI